MSKKKALKTLTDLGLKKTEAKIYFYLAKKGPKKAIEIIKDIGISRQRLYLILKNLQNKAIISRSIEKPAKFSAISYEKLLDLFASTKLEEAKILQQNKGKLLTDWKSIQSQTDNNSSFFFTVIQGRKYVHSKIQQMIQETQQELSIFFTISDYFRIEQHGVFDTIKTHPRRSKINFCAIINGSKKHLRFLKQIRDSHYSEIKVRVKDINQQLPIIPRLIIRDNEEILYFISQESDKISQSETFTCASTNCSSLISSFSKLFTDLWNKTSDIQQKIVEIETGKFPEQTQIISDESLAIIKFNEIFQKARKQVLMVIPTDDLLLYGKDPLFLEKLSYNGVLIKIMAPVSRDNIKTCLELSKFCEVRHVPNEYIKTVTIDGKHLFQFNTKTHSKRDSDSGTLNQILYSNDTEYIKKTNKMLLDIWKSAVVPSSSLVDSLIESQISRPGKNKEISKYKFIDCVSTLSKLDNITDRITISEQEVLDEISAYKTSSKKNSNVITLCGSTGHAIIHPHDNFNFPKLLINLYKISEESTFGSEDALLVNLWLETSKGFKYVPVAVVGDNPKASDVWKGRFKNSYAPVATNYNLFKKNEIQIQIYEKIMFAGWTKSIPLIPNLDPLPPSALILEGNGKIRTRLFEVTQDNGVRDIQRFNYFDSYITFLHQEHKYHGPATEGMFIRDMLIDSIIP